MEATALQNSMKVAVRKCREQSETEQVTRKKKKVECFASLTDDVLLEILERLPFNILRYKARYVCRRWFKIITNKILLEHASFILQKSGGHHTARFVDIREEKQGLEMEEEYLDMPCRGRIKSWCNEFLLVADPNKKESLYVFNLITKEGLYLPQCSTSCGGHYTCKCGVGLSFDGFKGVYKVVHVFMGPPIQCQILVLKRDIISRVYSKWKKIEVSSHMGEGQYYWGDLVLVQGRYFHWDVHSLKYLVSMDMVKERFCEMRLPGSDDYRMKSKYSFVEMGGFLTLLDNISWDQADLWILKDFQRMKWEKLQSISVSSFAGPSFYPDIGHPVPVSSVISKRYLIFRKQSGTGAGLFSYDLKNKLVKRLDIQIRDADLCVVHSTAPPSFL